MSDFVRGERAEFLFGQVRLWVLNKKKTRLIHEYYISKRFGSDAEYQSAAKDGFAVLKGAERAAKLLIAHGLAEAVVES
ncbi:hypothetical protein [Horticoccus sp. 23ND18S-11]|uniref:hypothetical protein n=1 Tax=Horticoccus sp. 23ND18S-11 TaxID=3391832 RepID=UPI0039C8E407